MVSQKMSNDILFLICFLTTSNISKGVSGRHGLGKFTIPHSPIPRYSRTTNNYAEHVNSVLKEARSLPILHAFYSVYNHVSTEPFQ
jgi:hypothetical protein